MTTHAAIGRAAPAHDTVSPCTLHDAFHMVGMRNPSVDVNEWGVHGSPVAVDACEAFSRQVRGLQDIHAQGRPGCVAGSRNRSRSPVKDRQAAIPKPIAMTAKEIQDSLSSDFTPLPASWNGNLEDLRTGMHVLWRGIKTSVQPTNPEATYNVHRVLLSESVFSPHPGCSFYASSGRGTYDAVPCLSHLGKRGRPTDSFEYFHGVVHGRPVDSNNEVYIS